MQRQMDDQVLRFGAHEGLNNALAVIHRRPVLAFYLLTFAISWGLIVLVLGPNGFLSTSETIAITGALGIAGPSLAGILLTGGAAGRAGLSDLKTRLVRWRISPRWYVVALLTAPILNIAMLLALSLASSEFRPAIVTEADKAGLLAAGIGAGLLVPVFEELGWTGFAMPRLRRRFSVLTTGLVMGVLWGAWHFPMFAGDADSSGSVPPVLYVAVLLFSWLPPYRVLMVWVYDHTGSLLLAMLMHVPIVVDAIVLGNDNLSGGRMVVSLLSFGGLLWLTVAAVALVDHGSSRGPRLDSESSLYRPDHFVR